MKKTVIQVSYGEEPVQALRWYMEQKGLSLEAELSKTVENLFSRYVPANVRSYITRAPENPNS